MPPHERIGRTTLSRSGGALHPTALALRARRARSAFAKNGTWHVPTLIRLRTQRFIQDQLYRTDLNLIYVSKATRQSGRYDRRRRCPPAPLRRSTSTSVAS